MIMLPKPSKGQSSARNIDGQDTDNDKNDFSITTTLTKGTGNYYHSCLL